jgi:PAS domain S-box-containing protein
MNFQSLIENSNEIIYEITLQGAIVSVSKKISGITRTWSSWNDWKISPIIHKDDKQKWFDFLSKIKLGKKDNENINYRVLHQEGHYVWHSSTIILIEKNNKSIT